MASMDAGGDSRHPAFTGPGPAAEYAAYLDQGRFMIQRCTKTGAHVFYPRVLSPHSGEPTLEWVAASGKGTVYSTTVIRRRPEQGGNANLAIVELAEGPRLTTVVVDINPTEVAIGMPVTARIDDLDGEKAVVFVPAGQEG